jgi:hypothetical protein
MPGLIRKSMQWSIVAWSLAPKVVIVAETGFLSR